MHDLNKSIRVNNNARQPQPGLGYGPHRGNPEDPVAAEKMLQEVKAVMRANNHRLACPPLGGARRGVAAHDLTAQ